MENLPPRLGYRGRSPTAKLNEKPNPYESPSDTVDQKIRRRFLPWFATGTAVPTLLVFAFGMGWASFAHNAVADPLTGIAILLGPLLLAIGSTSVYSWLRSYVVAEAVVSRSRFGRFLGGTTFMVSIVLTQVALVRAGFDYVFAPRAMAFATAPLHVMLAALISVECELFFSNLLARRDTSFLDQNSGEP
jgi:hypothetical protein